MVSQAAFVFWRGLELTITASTAYSCAQLWDPTHTEKRHQFMKRRVRVVALVLLASLGTAKTFAQNQKCEPVSGPATPAKLVAAVNCLVAAQSAQLYSDGLVLKKGQTTITSSAYPAVAFVVTASVDVATGNATSSVVVPGAGAKTGSFGGGHHDCAVSATRTTVTLSCKPQADADVSVFIVYRL
jgi:hypothetical protein